MNFTILYTKIKKNIVCLVLIGIRYEFVEFLKFTLVSYLLRNICERHICESKLVFSRLNENIQYFAYRIHPSSSSININLFWWFACSPNEAENIIITTYNECCVCLEFISFYKIYGENKIFIPELNRWEKIKYHSSVHCSVLWLEIVSVFLF